MSTQQTIGIVGGGQLGRMLTLAAMPLGFKVVVLNPESNSPAAQVGAEEIVADWYDAAAIKKLAEQSDFITIEFEHLDAQLLQSLVDTGKSVNPAPKTIRIIQDKFLQHQFLDKAGIAVAPFVDLPDMSAADRALEQFSGKMLVKAKHGAYDGRGNMVVTNKQELVEAFQRFDPGDLYAEAFVPFTMELAVMVARTMGGEISTFPVVQTIHERNICVEVLAPAPISPRLQTQAEELATAVAGLLDGAGVFGIEMFLTKQGTILVNEIAPRVHNSGHYTIEATKTSQFEQHIRAISGLPLGTTDLLVPAAVMVNILGERNGLAKVEGLDKVMEDPHINVHIYGKAMTKVDRKMGHITATGDNLEAVRKQAKHGRKNITI